MFGEEDARPLAAVPTSGGARPAAAAPPPAQPRWPAQVRTVPLLLCLPPSLPPAG